MIELAPVEPAAPGKDVQAPAVPIEPAGQGTPAVAERTIAAGGRPTAAPARPAAGKPAADEVDVADKEVAWLTEAAASLGVDGDTYERYAVKRWGQGWKKAAGGRKRALEDLTPFLDDAAGFVEKVRGELDVWTSRGRSIE